MSSVSILSMRRRPTPRLDRHRIWTGLAGATLLGGLALALAPRVPGAVAVAVAVLGTLAASGLMAAPTFGALRRHPALIALIALIALAALWVLWGVRHASQIPFFPPQGESFPYASFPSPSYFVGQNLGWPWRIGNLALLPMALALLCAGGGLVLLSDAVRAQLGLGPAQGAPWRQMTAPPGSREQVIWRAIPGVLLIGCTALLCIDLLNPYVAGDALLEALVLLVVGIWTTVFLASPLLVGALTRIDLDKAGRAREEERQRFAAHLHDSVLQTLALVQRQAHDPAAVIRLARRQEHALRAWMAGETELVSETLTATLRDVVAAVEDEYGITVELTAIGDRGLDADGEALVAAAREALRNAARHAPAAPVFVFAEITRSRVQVFIRDEGPGFELEAVAPERRGIRDAVIGRMASVGGYAAIDSTPGEGTEVVLTMRPRESGR
ncbi:MAG: sensor histidine kinase [Solirubrobacteraceae bacterium]